MEAPLLIGVYVFVLAMFVGFEVITRVPPTLHTPLMSGANAISGIAIVGALLVTGAGEGPLFTTIGMAALIMATINVVGGFMVTDRMLQMFRRREPEPGALQAGQPPGAHVAAGDGAPVGAAGREKGGHAP